MSRSTFRVRLRRGQPLRASQVALKLSLGDSAQDLVPQGRSSEESPADIQTPEAVPALEALPVLEAVPAPEEIPRLEPDSGPGVISTPTEFPKLTDLSAPKVAPEPESIPAPEIASAPEVVSAQEDSSGLEAVLVQEDTSAQEDSPTSEDASEEDSSVLEVVSTQEDGTEPEDNFTLDDGPEYEGLFQARHPVEAPSLAAPLSSPPPSPETTATPSEPWQESEDAPRTYSKGFVWLAMALTFGLGLGIGLMAWVFSVALREDIPSSPELRRLAMENTALSQSLERQQVELEAQQKKADDEDRRLRREWSVLVGEIEALEQEQDKAMERAQSLNDRLEIFVQRNDAVAQQTERPEDIRRQASALRDEGAFYRQALGGEMGRLDDEKQRFRNWMQRLEEQMKTRRVRGVTVRIIHDAQRHGDADAVAQLLNDAGADAHLFVTDITQTEAHKGRIYYHGKAEEEAARQIARMVRAIEPIEAESIGVTNPFLSLWIVGQESARGEPESP